MCQAGRFFPALRSMLGRGMQNPSTFFHGRRMTAPDPRKLRGLGRLNLGANGEFLQQPV